MFWNHSDTGICKNYEWKLPIQFTVFHAFVEVIVTIITHSLSLNLIELIDFCNKDFNLRESMMLKCDKTRSGVSVRKLTSLQPTSIHLKSKSLLVRYANCFINNHEWYELIDRTQIFWPNDTRKYSTEPIWKTGPSPWHYVLSPVQTIKVTASIPMAVEITPRSQHLAIFLASWGQVWADPSQWLWLCISMFCYIIEINGLRYVEMCLTLYG